MHLTRMLPRLACAPLLCALLVSPAGTALAAEPAGPPVEVTAIVEAADGRLSFVTQHAVSERSGADLARRLDARPDVVAASLEQRVYAVGTPDPLRPQQWGLTTLAAEQVWAGGTATGQVVAVLDTGVDAAHPDLAGIVAPGLDVVAATGTATIDPHGHGTHVAGIVAAVGENGVGGAGLAQDVQVLPVRVLDQNGAGTDGDVARGMVWAVDHGATVLNLSLGGPNPSPLLTSAVEYALAKGVVVIAAAGNAGANGDPVLYPAATPGVIAVGAVRRDHTRPTWSSTGVHLSLAAPGEGILSTVPGGGHASWSGTSMAAPFVAAAAALVRAGEPSLTPAELRTRLMATARDLGVPGPDPQYGAGLVDVLAARAAGLPATPPAGQPSDGTATEPVSEPVSEPVAPAPVAPAPVAPAPVAPAPADDPAPVAPAPADDPAPAPAPVAPAPVPAPATATPAPSVVTIRTSRSAAVVLPGRPVVLATRILADARAAGGAPVSLERRVGTGPWTTIRSGSTRPDGLVAWTLQPDRSGEHRFRTGSTLSGTVRVDVRQMVYVAARRNGSQLAVSATVAPGGRSPVALQVPRGNGWATIATTLTDGAGRARFVRTLPRGTRVRVYAPSRPALLPALSRELRP